MSKGYTKEWLSESERDVLLNSIEDTRNLRIIEGLYYGGFRISELLNMKREDLLQEGDNCYVLIREQKTDKKNWEKQPIPCFYHTRLIRFCKDNKIRTQDYIFSSRVSKRLSRSRAWQIVREECKKAGIEKKISTHSFRRSRIIHLLDEDFGLAHTSKFVRHANIQTTMIYAKLTKKAISNRLKRIDKEVIK
jgi:integrase/recombinase XerD